MSATFPMFRWMGYNDDVWYYINTTIGCVGNIMPNGDGTYEASVTVVANRGKIEEQIFDTLDEAKAWVEVTYRMNR